MTGQNSDEGHHVLRAATAAGRELQLRGAGALNVFDVLEGTQEFGSVLSRFEGAWWHLLADGRFFFEPARVNDRLSNSYILQGAYEEVDGALALQAENYYGPESMLALEALIRPADGRYILDCLFFEEGANSPVRRITQALTAGDERGMLDASRELDGVPAPALYDLELSGSTTGGSFSAVQSCLHTAVSFGDDHAAEPAGIRLTINHGSALDAAGEENGQCLLLMPSDSFATAAWGEMPPDWRFDFSVRDGHIRLALEDIPAHQSVFSWCEVKELITSQGGESRQTLTYFEARSLSLECRVSGDRLAGLIRAEGQSHEGTAGRYVATIAGRRAADAPQDVARLEQKVRLRARARGWRDIDIFQGEWQSRRLGQVLLSQSGETVHGTFSACPGVTLRGTASEHRLAFRTVGEGAGGHGVLRAARGGQFLAGFFPAPGGGPPAVEFLHRPEHSSRLVDELLRTSDPLAWNKQADVFKALRRDGEALILYGKVIEACAERRRQSVPYSEKWTAFFTYEWGALLAYMTCYQMRSLRLSNVRQHPDSGAEAADFKRLLEVFGQAVRMQAELTALARKVKAEEGVDVPDFGARLARQIELWRASLSDEAARMGVMETSQGPLAELLKVLVGAGNYEQALVVAESARARVFSDLLQNRIRQERARAALSSLPAEDVESLLARTMATAAPVELDSLKQTARKQRGVFVEYFLGDADLFVWVVSPGGRIDFKHQHREGLKETLDDCVAAARAGLGVRSREATLESAPQPPRQFLPQLAELYRLLVGPVAQWLPENETESVVFIPHGTLFLVPFPALFHDGKYLAERHTISVAPSIRFVETTHQMASRRESYPAGLLVAGDPLMPEWSFGGRSAAERLPQLEFARREAEQVAHKLGTQALTGERASKARILELLPRQKLVHLATHALIDDRVPTGGIPGAVALAPSDGDDGFLTAGEIAGLELRLRLVVLSACNTGRGRLSADGIVGLTRAFLTAGAECVVASLWSVADRSTQELMVEFYSNLRGGLPPAQALRRAMLTLKADERYGNPLYWAAFTVTGQTQTPLPDLFADAGGLPAHGPRVKGKEAGV